MLLYFVNILTMKLNVNMQPIHLHIHVHYMAYMHMHITAVCKIFFKNHMENPVPPPFWTNILFWFVKMLLRVKIYILALVYLKINFPAEIMLKINNLSRQNLPAPPPPLQNRMVALRHGLFDILGGGGLEFFSGPRNFFQTILEQDYFFRRPFGPDYFFYNQKL